MTEPGTRSSENATESEFPSPRPRKTGNVIALLCAGVVAGFISWYLMGQCEGYFQLPPGAVPPPEQQMRFMGNQQKAREMQELIAQVAFRNLLLQIAVTGATFAAVFGVAGGIGRRSVSQTLVAAVMGLAAGSALGVLAGLCMDLLEHRLHIPSMYRGLLVQASGWSLIGFGAALALALPDRSWGKICRHSAVGIVSGVLVPVVFPLVGIALLLITNSNQDGVIPSGSINRLAWSTTAGIVLAIALSLSEMRRQRSDISTLRSGA